MVLVLFSAISAVSATDLAGNNTVNIAWESPDSVQTDIEQNILAGSSDSFKDLDEYINNESIPVGGLVELEHNYSFYSSDASSLGYGGITISKSITIDGKGYTINGSDQSAIFRITNNAHVILRNIVFTNGNANDGGAIYVESTSTIQVEDCTFQNNSASNNGGAIFLADSPGSTSTIYNSVFTNNTAKNGGAIYGGSSVVDITLSDFSYNNATKYGGSLYIGGVVHILESTFDHDSASEGGALELYVTTDYYSTIDNSTIYNSTFKNCSVTGDGGAAYISSENVALRNVKFLDNVAGDDGGALYWEGNHGTIYNITCINDKGISIDKADGNTSSTRGGAICLTGNYTTVSKSNFTSCSAYMDEGKNSSKVDGGALFVTGNGIIIEDTSFTDCNATENGGALYVIGNGTQILNCNFTGSNAKNGSALYVEGNDCKLYNSNFTDNIADENGGAIFWEGDNGSINRSRFENNQALGFGNRTNNITVHNDNTGVDEVRYNITGGDGGAIMWKGSHGRIENSTFYQNTASYSGGAIYFLSDELENCTNITFRECNFTENLAKLNGGAINWASGASNATVTDSYFINNTAYRSAGAIYISGNYLEIKDTEFKYNNATKQTTYDNRTSAGVFSSEGGNAGAICWMGSYGTVDNGTFISNNAAVRGGAIQFERNQNGTVKNSRFKNNTAGEDGGAIDWYKGASSGKIINTNFTDNKASEDGGAVYIEGNDCKVYDSNFTTNNAEDEGGAVYVVGNRTNIVNCDFSISNAKDGAALWVNGTDCKLYNSTFKDNVADDDGGAIFWEGDFGLMYNITCNNNKGISSGTSSSRGGTICLSGDNVIVNKSHFDDSNIYIEDGRDFSKIDGGAILITGNNVTISETEFNDCSAINRGGAMYIMGNNSQILDCNFSYTQAYIGGAIYVEGNGAIIDNSLFRHNDGFNESKDGGSGGAIYVEGDNATISNSDFAYGKVINYGGAISVWGANANITKNVFDNCTSTKVWGGAIYTNGENATISLSNFTRCIAEREFGRGGAIQVSGNEANVLECNFEDCFAFYGGVIDISGNNAHVNNSTFKHSATFKPTADINVYDVQSPQWGGAIYVTGENATIFLSNFTDFTAEDYGGAIFVEGANANISESEFLNCNVNNLHGGAIYITGEDTYIGNSNFTSCDAVNNNDGSGGAICINGPNTVINGSHFDDCEAKMGGDIYVFGNGAKIDNSTFDDSEAEYGGAIYLTAWGAVIKQVNITNCEATYSGGAIYVAGGGTTIIGSDFEDCFATGTSTDDGGGAIYVAGSYNNISGSNFNNNRVINDNARGGTIYISSGEGTNIERSYFNKSYAGQGGIIFIEGNEVIISSSTFANSSSKFYGGAIYVEGDNATIQKSDFYNLETKFGGAIFVDGEYSNILNSSFDKCTASSDGGAIYINDMGTTVAYSNFTHSSASTGGAMYLNGVNTTITYCNITFNTAKSAGAIKVSGSDSYISNCNISYNNATSGAGGAVDIGGERASIYYSYLSFNRASGNGGAINWQGGHGNDSIIGTTFVNNTSYGPQGGGAIFWTVGDVMASGGLIQDCIFINNSAKNKHGGALNWFRTEDSKIDNCLFINNYASSDGGALYTGDQGGKSSNLTFINSQFYNNTAGKHGGAIANQMARSYIYNITFDGNKAGYSGGSILMKEGPAKGTIIDHCYIYNSYCNQQGDKYGDGGGAIHIKDENITISNCAIINSTTNKTFGGAISFEKSSKSSLINVTIQNVATNSGNGGAIYWSGDNGYLYNVTIFNASANSNYNTEANGGAIYLSGSNANFNNLTIATSSSNNKNTANSNSTNGGAIYVSGNNNAINNLTIDDSQANSVRMDANGGAIYWTGSSGTLKNASISNTLANGKGGAIYWSGSSKAFENVSIEYSQTNVTSTSIENNGCGGAIYTTTITELKNVYIMDAKASTESGDIKGGAIYFAGSKLNNVTVIGSRAVTGEGTSYGGAVYLQAGSDGEIKYSSFRENTADLGGAVFSDRGVSISNTSFVGNVALDGGALYGQSGDDVITGSTFELNSAERGGAIFAEQVNIKIDGSTLRNNTVEEKGGAIYHNNNGESYIRNSNLTNNTAFQGSAIYTTNFFELKNVILLDNQANSKEFIEKGVGVDEQGRNYTSGIFVGYDNLLNSIWDEEDTVTVSCNNVTYWGVNGVNVSNSIPVKSDREVWQNITVEMFDDEGKKINETVVITDGEGKFKYIFNAEEGKTYYFAYTHKTDRYYTYLRETISNSSLVKVYVLTPLYYGQNQTLIIELTDGAWGEITGNVTVDVKGPITKTFNITVINGTWIKENISGLPLGEYNITATFAGDLNHTGDTDSNSFVVLPNMDLNITKVVNITADFANVSDVIRYTINVTNHGPSNATGVNVTEELSPYLRMIKNETQYGYYNLTNKTWFIGDLEAGETATLIITAEIIHSGPITNTVWVYGDGNDTNMSNNVASAHNFTAVDLIDLNITKWVNITADVISVLDEIQFNITVFNHGPSNATGVYVHEALDDHLMIISNHTSDGSIYSGDTWQIGTLANGTNVTLTIVAKVVYSGNFTNNVTVVGFENESSYDNNFASVKNFTAIANVDVGINKTVNVTGCINVSDIIEFNITVYNNGPSNASGVFVSEVLNPHLELISYTASDNNSTYDNYTWTIGRLNAGETVNLTIVARIISNGTIANAVNVTSNDNDTNTSNNNDSIDNITALPIVDLEINKTVTFGGSVVNVTDYIQFKITVTNHGPSTATDVNVTEKLSKHLQMNSTITVFGHYDVTEGIWHVGDLTNGTTAELIIGCYVISNGTISNFVIVTSNENDTNTSNNNDTIDNITALPIVDLGITKTVNVTTDYVNVTEVIQYTITVYNDGPCNATQVNVTEGLSPHLRLIKNETEHGYYNATEGIWHIGNLTNKTSAVLTLLCEVTGNGTIHNVATVRCYENETYWENNTAQLTIISEPIVDLRIVKEDNITGVREIDVMDIIKFNVTVYNDGPCNATGVYVREPLSPLLTLINYTTTDGSVYIDKYTWRIGNLANGTNVTLTIYARVSYSGNITNNVEVFLDQPDPDRSNNVDNITNITAYAHADVGINKTVNVTGFVNVSDIIQFNITVYNNGPCNASGVVVTEPLDLTHLELISYNTTNDSTYDGHYTWVVGNVNAGETVNMTIVAKVKAPGIFNNFVSVTCYDNDTNTSNDNWTTDNITALPIVDLEINKTVVGGASVVYVPGYVEFQINVTNHGPSPATNVNVTEHLDTTYLEMISSSTVYGYYNVTEGIWHLEQELGVNQSAILLIGCSVKTNGTIINFVSVNSTENDTNTSNNNDTLTLTSIHSVDLFITKAAYTISNSTTIYVGDTIRYEIYVQNNGPCNATNVVVNETLSELVELTGERYAASAGTTYDPDTGLWTIGNLNVLEFATLTIWVKAKLNGTISNVVSVNSSESEFNPDDNNASAINITALPVVNLTIVKTANVSGLVHVNDFVNFTINVTNNGPSNATNVNITDRLPAGLEFASAGGNVTGTKTLVDGVEVVTWNIPYLNNATTVTLWVVVQVKANGTFKNVASVNSTENDTTSNTDAEIYVNPVNNFTVIKSSNWTNNIGYINDMVNFTITVTNNGPSNASNVNITDILDSNFEFNSTDGYYDSVNHKIIWHLGDMDNGVSREVWVIVKVINNGTFRNTVTVNSTENETGTTNGTDITANPVNNLTLIKYANVTGNIMVNDLVNFTINVTNHGPSNATNVNVTDILLAEFELIDAGGNVTPQFAEIDGKIFVTWEIGDLNNGEMVSLWVVVQVKTNGTFRNVASVNSTENTTGTSNGTDITANPINNLTLIKYANVTGNIMVNDLVNFTINVTNHGPSNATNVNVTDNLPAGFEFVSAGGNVTGTKTVVNGVEVVTWEIGNLNNGTMASVWVVVKVKTNGTFTNVATVNSTENNTGTSNDTDVTADPVNNFTVIKYANVTEVGINDLVNFTINVTNNGPSDATNVNVSDVLDVNFEYVDSNGVYDSNTREVFWNVGNMVNGSRVSVWVVVKVKTNGTFTNVATVNSTENTTSTTNNTDIKVNPVNNLTLIKYANVTNVMVNDYVNFTINVTNNGPSNASNVNVTDKLPAGFEFVSAGGNVTGTKTIVEGQDAVIWNIGDLNNGDMVSLWVVVKVITNGTVTNVATVNSTENRTGTSNGTDIVVNPVNNLTLIKYANVTGNIMANDLVNFTINVTNLGPSNATGVNITDKLPAGFEFISAGGNVTGTKTVIDGKNAVIWNIGDLNNGAMVSVWVVVKVITNGTFTNVATVNSTENRTGTSNSTDVTADPVNNFTIIKYANVTEVGVNDLVNFTINVTNNGPSDATNVNVSDVLDVNFEYVDSNGVYDSNAHGVFWNVGNMVNGSSTSVWVIVKVKTNGTFTNFATVNSTENKTNTTNSTDIVVKPVTNLTIIKYANVTENVRVDDLVNFTINVTNHGPSNATNVNVTDTLPAGLEFVSASGNGVKTVVNGVEIVTWDIGDLNNGSMASVWVVVKVKASGTIKNFATVNSTENTTGISNETKILSGSIDLNITKTVNTQSARYGDVIVYTIIVKNHGPDNATDVNVTEKLSNLVRLVEASPNKGRYDSNTNVWHVGNLTNNTEARLTLRVQVISVGIIENFVNVTANENDTDYDNNNYTSDNVTAIPADSYVWAPDIVEYYGIPVSVPVTSQNALSVNYYITNSSGSVVAQGNLLPGQGISNLNYEVGTYTVHLTTVTDANHYPASYDSKITILKVGTPIEVEAVNITYGDNETITITLPSDRNGTINVTVANRTFENLSIGNGTIKITVPDLAGGNYTVNVTYSGDRNHYGNTTGTTFEVARAVPVIKIYVEDIWYGEVEVLNVTVNAPGTVNITVDGKTIEMPLDEIVTNPDLFKATWNLVNLSADTYPAFAAYNGNENYTSVNTSDVFIVKPLPTIINVTATNITYGEDETIIVTIPSDRTGTINVTVGDRRFDNLPVGNGTIKIVVPDLAGGNYTVNVTYSGDRNHYGNTTGTTFEVARAVPVIKIYVEDIWYGEVEVLNVTVNAPGTVNITVYGITIEVPLNESVTTTDVLKAAFRAYDGKATWNLVNLPVGTYPAFAVYNGNENYTSVSTSDVFIVKPLPTTVKVSVEDIYVGEDAIIKIKVGPDGLKGNVTIILEGKKYIVNVTGNSAELVVSGLKAGIKNVSVIYWPGNTNYLPSENTTTFKVIKILPPIDSTTHDIEYGEDETIIIHLPGDATGEVTIIVDGKKYTATLKNGKATFKIPGLKPGKYNVEVYYSGDDKYLPTGTSDSFKVSEKEVPVPTPDDGGHSGIDLTRHATGNPIVAILIMLLGVGVVVARRFKDH